MLYVSLDIALDKVFSCVVFFLSSCVPSGPPSESANPIVYSCSVIVPLPADSVYCSTLDWRSM